ncbi:MAG: Stk1 family PASTA domain-containing Ser/Thr kinase [Lachnospiraceae bacterium]|nr:Stk1 family PASTA domain-containing Ser/Thr kinase [Lachnospiraceae bacterium]
MVGAGGMSIVYKARCHRLNRNVAIKVLKPEFARDQNFVTKFRVEAQASAGLTHPNIVNVYDVYDDDGIYFIVMELVDGITLKDYIAEFGRLSMDKAIDFALQIASGLEAAHESHIIHRDIKPQNIIVSKTGNIKVTDFGIAKAATSNTLTSGAMGSVHYISPEQARGGYSDERSDIYSLGITMYEMVTGRVPFEGDNNVSVALMHIQSEMISPRQYYPDIYSSFEKVILKATQKKPERRYLTASALIADLKRVQNNPNIDIVVAPTAVTNSPTQEWTKEDVQAIRDGSAVRDAYGNSQLDAFAVNPPIQNDMGELGPVGMAGGISPIPVNNQRINQLIDDSWEDDYEDDYVEQPVKPRAGVKKIQDDYEDDYDDGEMDPSLRKAVTIGAIALAVIIAIILMVVLGNVLGWFNKDKSKPTTEASTTNKGELVMIDVIDFSEQKALDMLEKAGFTNVTVEPVTDAEVPEGYVVDQSVKPNDVIKADDEVIIYVSSGAEQEKVPNVEGLSDEQACKLIEEAGFKYKHAYAYDDEVEKDFVIMQSPEGGEMAAKGSTVTITVSNGSEEKEVDVPNLYGLTEDQAVDSLESLKLVAGKIDEEYHDSVPEGMVISQSISHGTPVTEGTKVDIVISKGPEEKLITYDAKISGSVTLNDSSLDGTAVTVQIRYDGVTVSEQTITVTAGTPNSVSGVKSGLESQSGSADIIIIDASGANVTASFSCTTSVSYVEVEEPVE